MFADASKAVVRERARELSRLQSWIVFGRPLMRRRLAFLTSNQTADADDAARR